MARRLLLLLIATLALGGVFALRTRKPEKRPVAAITTNIPALRLDTHAVEASPQSGPAAFSPRTVLTSRIALLVVVAAGLATGAYFGLGKGSETVQAAQSQVSEATEHASVSKVAPKNELPQPDEIRSLRAEARNVIPPAAPTPAPPVPTPAVAAEVETPAPVPAPAAVAFEAPPDGIEAILCALPWPCQEAINIAACESGRDRNGRLDGAWASNGNHYGVFQISYIHASRWPDFYDNWMDPAKNAQWAYEIWAEQGWYPWSCRWATYY